MSDVEVWRAVAEQADAWADAPAFQRFAAELPRNASQRAAGLPGLLQNVQASGVEISGRPLVLGTLVPAVRANLPGYQTSPPDSSLTSWLEDALRVESAHRSTVAWLRSRIPGYPNLPAPQLVRGTPLTTQEFTWRLIWTPEERGLGLQFLPAPREAAQTLEAAPGEQRRLDEAARAVAEAFHNTEEWTRHAAARSELGDEALLELSAACAALSERLKPEAIDAYEGHFALPRNDYREAAVSEVVAALSGAAREYAEAFDALDRLQERAASDVFGQLAAYRNIATCAQPRNLDFVGANPQTVAFTLTDQWLPETGMLLWVNDPLLPDAVRITGVAMNFDQLTGVTFRVHGSVLAGTSEAWRSPSVTEGSGGGVA